MEDEKGRSWCEVIPYDEASPAEQKAALKRLERLQKKVGKATARKGLTEDDFDRLLQDR